MLYNCGDLLGAAQIVPDAAHGEIRTVKVRIDDVVRSPGKCHHVLCVRAIRGNRPAFEQVARQIERGGKREAMGVG